MRNDTGIGGSSNRFPETQWSAIVAARSADAEERQRAFGILIAAYWKPVYKYLRVKWNKPAEDAEDLTQGFFLRVIEKDFFRGYDPSKARFRTFVRTCLDGFVSNEAQAARRLKRGGGTEILSLDFESAEGELTLGQIPASQSAGEYFEKEWIRSFFALVVETLREDLESGGKGVHFRLFERYSLDPQSEERRASYAELASEFGLSVSDVTNYLALARREFRKIVLGKLREVTVTDEEFRREAQALLGVDPG